MLTPLDSVSLRQRPTAAPIVPLFRWKRTTATTAPRPFPKPERSAFPPIDPDNCVRCPHDGREGVERSRRAALNRDVTTILSSDSEVKMEI